MHYLRAIVLMNYSFGICHRWIGEERVIAVIHYFMLTNCLRIHTCHTYIVALIHRVLCDIGGHNAAVVFKKYERS